MKLTGLENIKEPEEVSSELSRFNDAGNIGSWAKSSVAAAVKAGIVSGYNKDTIAPKADITRAEAAVIIRRLLSKAFILMTQCLGGMY
jgi:hypothetical protein